MKKLTPLVVAAGLVASLLLGGRPAVAQDTRSGDAMAPATMKHDGMAHHPSSGETTKPTAPSRDAMAHDGAMAHDAAMQGDGMAHDDDMKHDDGMTHDAMKGEGGH